MTKVGAGLNLVLSDNTENGMQGLLFTVDLVPSFLVKVKADYSQLNLRQVRIVRIHTSDNSSRRTQKAD